MLSPAQRVVLDAVARRVVPHAYTGDGGVDLVARIEERLAGAPPERVRDVRLGLTVLGSRLAALAFSGMAVPFPRLAAERQDVLLSRWATSPVGIARAVYHGVRRLVLAVYYAQPESFDEIGYLGPFHLRAPVFAWEGPVPATGGAASNADEPVARATAGARGASADAPSTAAAVAAASAVSATPGAGPVAAASAAAASARPGHASPGDIRLSADVIVVGSGAGGAAAAARLAEAGRNVLLLEAGSLVAGDELNEREGDMTARLYAESGMRATDDLSVVLLQGAAVGGGTLVNWMITFRTPDHVLDEWTRRFGITGFAPSEMAPVFDRVEREIHATLVPGDAHSPANRILLTGARALGWRAGAGRINARGCVRSGFCGLGCRYGAKQSADRVYVPRAIAAGARLVSDARVERIEVVERDGAAATASRGSRARTPPRKRVHATLVDRDSRRPTGRLVAEAPVVVLAAGAVSTPVLLARSGMGGGAVGNFLRLHPTTAVAGVHDADVYAAAGVPQSAVCDEFIRSDANGYGFWIECAPHHPSLGAVATPGFGAEHRTLMREFRRTANLIVLVRDGADLEMSNGSVRPAATGGARIRYRLGPRDKAHLVRGVEAAARIQLAAGAREVRSLHTVPFVARTERDLEGLGRRPFGPNDLVLFSAHVNGTCRMGTDRAMSGAAPSGERHGVRGLYVADGSLLPTGLGVNPQATIMAIATMIAERMVSDVAW